MVQGQVFLKGGGGGGGGGGQWANVWLVEGALVIPQ